MLALSIAPSLPKSQLTSPTPHSSQAWSLLRQLVHPLFLLKLPPTGRGHPEEPNVATPKSLLIRRLTRARR
jgi:hypothetical protein